MKSLIQRMRPRAIPGPVLLALLSFSTTPMLAQPGNQQSALTLLNIAFSHGNPVQQVQLSGNATWYAGDTEDSGTATLTGNADGSYQVQLSLSASGQRIETETGAGTDAICQWSFGDDVLHTSNAQSCWRPVLWFLPAVSLQPTLQTLSVASVDGGMGTVGANEGNYRIIQSQLTFTGFSSSVASDFAQASTVQLGIDPSSFMPMVLAYSTVSDNGSAAPSTLEIHYSDYRTVNGVEIPFLIQRYVNGSLQLSVAITSAQIS